MQTIFTPPKPNAIDTSWFIDVRPFFKRFGGSTIAVLSSTDAQVQAAVTYAMSSKWIDLKDAEVSQLIDLIISKQIPGVDATLKQSVLTTPVSANEQMVLIKLYFT